jgi:hypothetical protein
MAEDYRRLDRARAAFNIINKIDKSRRCHVDERARSPDPAKPDRAPICGLIGKRLRNQYGDIPFLTVEMEGLDSYTPRPPLMGTLGRINAYVVAAQLPALR